jgi:hypothetical protein
MDQMAPEEGEPECRREILLIQRLLAKAVQPSPTRSTFTVEELESAALSVAQYLASASAAKKTNLGSPLEASVDKNGAPVTDNEVAAAVASKSGDASLTISMQGAAALVGATQPAQSGSAVTSQDLRRSRRQQRPRARPPSPPQSVLRQLAEMGFTRKAVEHALKALGGAVGDMSPSPESLVAWLLENQDQV